MTSDTESDPSHLPTTVVVADVATGETRISTEHTPWYWAEGNGACDCNRAALFDRDEPCGNSRYYIVQAVADDGTGYTLEDYNRHYPGFRKP